MIPDDQCGAVLSVGMATDQRRQGVPGTSRAPYVRVQRTMESQLAQNGLRDHSGPPALCVFIGPASAGPSGATVKSWPGPGYGRLGARLAYATPWTLER